MVWHGVGSVRNLEGVSRRTPVVRQIARDPRFACNFSLDSSSSSDVPYQISTHFSSLTHTHTMTRAPSLHPADERSISIFSSRPQNSSDFSNFRPETTPPFVDLDLHCPSLSLFSIPVLATLTSPHLGLQTLIHTYRTPSRTCPEPFSFLYFSFDCNLRTISLSNVQCSHATL